MGGFFHFCWFNTLVAHINTTSTATGGFNIFKRTATKCFIAFMLLFFFERSVNTLVSSTTISRWITALYALMLQAGYMWMNRGTPGPSPATDVRQDKPSSFGFEKEAEPSEDRSNVPEEDHDCKSGAQSTREEIPMQGKETRDINKEIEPNPAKLFIKWRAICNEFFSHPPGSQDLPILPSKALLAELFAAADNPQHALKQEARRWHPNRAFFHQMEAAGRLGTVRAATEMFQAIQNIRDEIRMA
ncbi:hypothetical protein NU219Hw_g837t1 [Hortaea werneckii]